MQITQFIRKTCWHHFVVYIVSDLFFKPFSIYSIFKNCSEKKCFFATHMSKMLLSLSRRHWKHLLNYKISLDMCSRKKYSSALIAIAMRAVLCVHFRISGLPFVYIKKNWPQLDHLIIHLTVLFICFISSSEMDINWNQPCTLSKRQLIICVCMHTRVFKKF